MKTGGANANLGTHHRTERSRAIVSIWSRLPVTNIATLSAKQMAEDFLVEHGREETLRIWREYPLLNYGKKWDIY